MKVLVIGSNSFSGSNLVNKLLNEGYDVIGISRSEEYSDVFLPYKKNPRLKTHKNLTVIMVTHRLKSLKNCNRVFKITSKGEVVEE